MINGLKGYSNDFVTNLAHHSKTAAKYLRDLDDVALHMAVDFLLSLPENYKREVFKRRLEDIKQDALTVLHHVNTIIEGIEEAQESIDE